MFDELESFDNDPGCGGKSSAKLRIRLIRLETHVGSHVGMPGSCCGIAKLTFAIYNYRNAVH